ncbi:MAG: hypothetical protein ABWY57_07485 [Mycetocola sp.]
MRAPQLRAVQGPLGWGVSISQDAFTAGCLEPIRVEVRSDPPAELCASYERVEILEGEGFRGTGLVVLSQDDASRCSVLVTDEWRVVGDEVVVSRSVRVQGSASAGFHTSLALIPERDVDWGSVEPFVPGVTYGNAPRVAAGAIGGLPSRMAGVETILVREDRMAAPLFAVRFDDGAWFGVLHLDPAGETTSADGLIEDGGETLTDERFRFGSLGGRCLSGRLELGLTFPGSEGEMTYTSGGLPLRQVQAWRRRYHPARDGLEQNYRLAFRIGTAADTLAFFRDAWHWAWRRLVPVFEVAPIDQVVRECTAVLSSQVVVVDGRTGIPLESDAVDPIRSVEDTSAVMGFVGANTDAGYLLLRVADSLGGPDAARYRRQGEDILDTFSRLPLDPPAGEGFDTVTGKPTTYRAFDGHDAVYARSIAEGCLAALDGWRWDATRGVDRPNWLRWAVEGGEWLVAQQKPDGSLPRAWIAGTGKVLDGSTSAAFAVVPFLVALSVASARPAYMEAAEKAADYVWRSAGAVGAYAGATLDNPDVVDKEAAILSAEGFLDLFDVTGDSRWLDRAASAATVAASWVYLWDVPMPTDALPADLHWKPGVSTIGHQLITTGCSMTDGFLAVNASAFARLFAVTGEEHWLDLARLVVHGGTSMLALADRPFDLRGPGWQQEHWSFAPRRGMGLNRRWLPWVPVAHVRGIHRLEDLGVELSNRVLRP